MQNITFQQLCMNNNNYNNDALVHSNNMNMNATISDNNTNATITNNNGNNNNSNNTNSATATLGQPCVYWHHSKCQHMFYISDIHTFHPTIGGQLGIIYIISHVNNIILLCIIMYYAVLLRILKVMIVYMSY